MTFIDTRLPTKVERGAVRRDAEDVEIITTDGGFEERNVRHAQSLLEFDVSFPHSRTSATFLAVRALYRVARGPLHTFRFRDWSEYQVTAMPFGTGNGVATVFQLSIGYTAGPESYERTITRPVAGVVIAVDGTPLMSGVSVNLSTGAVTFSVAPPAAAVLTWTGEFDLPVRFDSTMATTMPEPGIEHIETLSLREVKE